MARQAVTNTLRAKKNGSNDYTVTCLNGVLSIKELSPGPKMKSPASVTKDIEGLVPISEEELTDREEEPMAKEEPEADVNDNDCKEKEINSKHLLM